ncbi:ArsR/SmtB family transcription factor [Phytohabitans sp. LJ34]|uniref:ArsR/SmtB family transcription factor n=1 Tax=Phytohabitans sp. LJ34 TaxID=3452217 RepID=UPI003F891FE2
MLRIHFTPQDVARVRMVVLGPLAETQLSMRTLHNPMARVEFTGWRERVAPRVPGQVRALARFLAPTTCGPIDLFTPVGPVADVDHGLDRLLGAPELREELAVPCHRSHPRPAWLTPTLDRGDRDHLAAVLRAGHQVAIKPFWRELESALEIERTRCARLLLEGGVDMLMAGLHPSIRWRDGVLELTEYRPHVDSAIHLSGRGVILAPSFFCQPGPMVFTSCADAGDSPTLIYPIDRDLRRVARIWAPTGQGGQRALRALLGRARATVLEVIASGSVTTTEIARRAGISPSSASEHATVLRDAGLVASRRDQNRVLHTITSAGAAILNGTSKSVAADPQRR